MSSHLFSNLDALFSTVSTSSLPHYLEVYLEGKLDENNVISNTQENMSIYLYYLNSK